MPRIDDLVETDPERRILVVNDRSVEHANDGLLFGASLENQAVNEATLHVFSVRIDGQLTSALRNVGRLPLMRGNVQRYLAQLESHDLFDASQHVGGVRRGGQADITRGWQITGPLNVLWNLMRILFAGSARVTQYLDFKAVGYHKTFDQDVQVPVGGVAVRWD